MDDVDDKAAQYRHIINWRSPPQPLRFSEADKAHKREQFFATSVNLPGGLHAFSLDEPAPAPYAFAMPPQPPQRYIPSGRVGDDRPAAGVPTGGQTPRAPAPRPRVPRLNLATVPAGDAPADNRDPLRQLECPPLSVEPLIPSLPTDRWHQESTAGGTVWGAGPGTAVAWSHPPPGVMRMLPAGALRGVAAAGALSARNQPGMHAHAAAVAAHGSVTSRAGGAVSLPSLGVFRSAMARRENAGSLVDSPPKPAGHLAARLALAVADNAATHAAMEAAAAARVPHAQSTFNKLSHDSFYGRQIAERDARAEETASPESSFKASPRTVLWGAGGSPPSRVPISLPRLSERGEAYLRLMPVQRSSLVVSSKVGARF